MISLRSKLKERPNVRRKARARRRLASKSKQITRTLKLLRTKAISNPVSTKKNPSLLPKRRTTRIRRKLTLRQP
jgi:hypothetical protein